MQPVSQECFEELQRLARDINEHAENAGALGNSAREAMGEWLKEVLLCGRALSEAHAKVPRRDWKRWLVLYVSKLSYRTAMRWIQLAEMSRGTQLDLSEARGVRHACNMLGIREDAPAGPKAEAPAAPDGSEPKRRSVVRFNQLATVTIRKPAEQWQPEEREQFKQWLVTEVMALLSEEPNSPPATALTE